MFAKVLCFKWPSALLVIAPPFQFSHMQRNTTKRLILTLGRHLNFPTPRATLQRYSSSVLYAPNKRWIRDTTASITKSSNGTIVAESLELILHCL